MTDFADHFSISHNPFISFRVNNENKLQGKLGIALIKATDFAKIILYRTKEDILSTKVIKRDSTVFFKQGYLRYLDDTNEYWSLHFAKDEDRDAFLASVEDIGNVERETDRSYEEPKKEPAQNVKTETVDSLATGSSGEQSAVNSGGAISRVAKVGHQLPKLDVVKNKQQDSDTSSPPQSPQEVHRKPFVSSMASTSNSIIRTADPHNASFAVPNNLLANMVMQQNNTNSCISNFLTESRVNSSESRVQMSKLETKIDRMLDKIDYLKLNAGNKTGDEKDDEILQLEERIVELKKENRILKQQVKDSNSAAAAVSVAAKASSKDSDDGALVAVLTVDLTEANHTIDQLQRNARGKDQRLVEADKRVAALEAELKDAKSKAVQQHSNGGRGDEAAGQSVDLIRGIMNDFYQKLYQGLDQRNSWPKQEVLKMAADLIRSETKAALNRQK